MKYSTLKHLFYILLCFASYSGFAQTFYLKIQGTNKTQTQIIDSVNYSPKHKDVTSLLKEIKNTEKKISNLGYLDLQTLEIKKTNDSTYNALFDLKKQIKYIRIYIGRNIDSFDSKISANDSIVIPYSELENFLNQKVLNNEKKGFAFTKIKLENIRRKNSIIYADLNLNTEKKRTISSIIINYTNPDSKDYFPKGALKQLNKKYINKTFNQEITQKIYNDIGSFEFITQPKYPEILFTQDSTKIYTYLEKRKANTFDGYIGFSNDENKKLKLNGYLDITLVNTLRAGEKFSLYWKSDGNDQKTFNTKIEIPYLFQSSLGIKAQLNIFKQDSTFQNTKTDINLGYYLNYNSKLYLGYQSTESSDIQNTNNSSLSDFNNSYLTSSYDYKILENENLFSTKAIINATIGHGKRETPNDAETAGSSKQLLALLNVAYNFELNKKNYVYLNSQNYYLQSKNYITNELFRFGGMNSIRGFSENSLQANYANLLLTEYRYLPTSNFYVHSILDYGIYQDQTFNKKVRNILSFGVGLGLLTKGGLLKIQLANGSANKGEIKFYNSILNICYNVKF